MLRVAVFVSVREAAYFYFTSSYIGGVGGLLSFPFSSSTAALSFFVVFCFGKVSATKGLGLPFVALSVMWGSFVLVSNSYCEMKLSSSTASVGFSP